MRVTIEHTLEPLAESNVEAFRALNTALFPVPYPAAMYNYLLRADSSLSRLAYADTILIGAVSCRLESPTSLYILTLGVLPTYRELGLGSTLLQYAITVAREKGLSRVRAHVQEGNEDALRLYRKVDFEVVDYVTNYYRHVSPAHAHIVERLLPVEKDNGSVAMYNPIS